MQLSTSNLLLMSGVGVFASALSLIFLWLANKDIKAVRYWALSACLLLAGLLLLNIQDVLPGWVKFILPNFVLQTSFWLILYGTYQACEQQIYKFAFFNFIFGYSVLHLIFTFFIPSYQFRFTLGIFTALISLVWMFWGLYRYSNGKYKISTRLIFLSITILVSVSLVKVFDLNWGAVNTLNQDESFKSQWFIIAFFMCQLLFNFAFAIMVGEIRHYKNKLSKEQLVNMNIALSKENERAEAHSKLKSEFLANMSHEIRTPINGVIGCLDLLQSTNLSTQQLQYTELAHASANSLLGVINDILDFSKIESGKLAINPEQIDLLALLDSVAKSFAIELSQKPVTLYVDCHQVMHHTLLLDPVRLRQILNNLLSNAIKFTKQGHVQLSLSSQKNAQGKVVLTANVSDTGVGISEQGQRKLFNAFSQCDASTTRLFGGTGLGLVIVKRLCKLMGGDIELVNSELDKGSEFVFSILVDEVHIQQADLEQSMHVPNNIALYSPNDTFLTIMQNQFKSRGFSLSVLDTKNIAKNYYELIILDLVNCKESGLEYTFLIESAKSHANEVCIICAVNSELSNHLELGITECSIFYHPFTCYDLMQLFTKKKHQETTEPLILKEDLSANSLYGLKVLLAEDNKVNQIVATKMLSNWGIEFEIANSGQEVLNILREHKSSDFDMILMDCQMPLLDGYQTTQQIRTTQDYAVFKNIPIIALTANAMTGDKEKCLESGMSGYVSKPIEAEALRKEISNQLVGSLNQG